MLPINIPLSTDPYKVFVGENLLKLAGSTTSSIISPCRCAILSDENVAPLYAQKLIDSLREAHFEPLLITIPATEKSKSLEQVQSISSQMFEAGLNRKASLFALGGGVIGDLAGFIASIFCRGIPLIHLPTTLLAQVDSSLGGKTGVNLLQGKNLLGTFHQPCLVLSDTTTLSTLPKKIFNDGFAEIIKHAIIGDRDMLSLFPINQKQDLSSLIARNIKIKGSIVAEDEYDTFGRRALLNFGHTIGHAIEAATNYEIFSHGEAIALGIVAALNLSMRHAGLPPEEYQQIIQLLCSCELPTRIAQQIPHEKIIKALLMDKKFQQGSIRFILSPRLGHAFISSDITLKEIEKTLQACSQ